MTLLTIQDLNNGNTLITERGVKLTIKNSMVPTYLKARQDIINLGEKGAIEKWCNEEDKARKRAGLPKATHTQPLHYGTHEHAACGVHKGAQGTIRQPVLWHTLNKRKVSCEDCLEAMENE